MLKLVKGVEKKNHHLLTTISERRGDSGALNVCV